MLAATYLRRHDLSALTVHASFRRGILCPQLPDAANDGEGYPPTLCSVPLRRLRRQSFRPCTELAPAQAHCSRTPFDRRRRFGYARIGTVTV